MANLDDDKARRDLFDQSIASIKIYAKSIEAAHVEAMQSLFYRTSRDATIEALTFALDSSEMDIEIELAKLKHRKERGL